MSDVEPEGDTSPHKGEELPSASNEQGEQGSVADGLGEDTTQKEEKNQDALLAEQQEETPQSADEVSPEEAPTPTVPARTRRKHHDEGTYSA
jgi:hypothetical protein